MVQSKRVEVEQCEFSHLAGVAILVKKSTQVSITNSVFLDIGAHGIMREPVNMTEYHGD